ncbi:MAG: hypothetical protein DMG83_04440 [Acidobacteria bacterium]|nr:MAG: hypothetical protein DMG83_04440 [Acidobacteriota bacterium]
MVKKYSQFAGVLVAVALLASIASGQQTRVYHDGDSWTEEVTGSLSAARNLHIRVDFGSVRVQGSSQHDITYVIRTRSYGSDEKQARREFEAYKINASAHGDTALIEGDWQGHRHNLCSGEFVINVPRNLDLAKIETSGGGVTVNGIAGRVEAESGGGKIQLDDIGGTVTAQTGGDSIEIGTVNGDLRLETGGGRINIANAKGKVNATTGGGNIVLISGAQGATLEAGGGNIDVKKCGGKLKVSTGGGNIELGDVSGPVEIETGGGSIRLGWAKGVVRAQTGAGRIELNGVSSAHAETGAGGILARFISSGERTDSVLETSAGDIVVYIAPDVAMTIRASIDLANGHKIQSDFSDIRVTSEGGDWPGPKSFMAEGKLNGGGPTLKVRTTTGDIKFLRASR